MRYALIIIAFFFCTIKTEAQVYQAMPQAGYGPVKRMLIDSVLTIPIGLSQLRNITGGRDTAQLRYQKSDSSVYVYSGSSWIKLGTGGGGGGSADSTVFFTVYRADTMRANIYGAIPQPDTLFAIYPIRISNDSIYLAQSFVDSVGTGGGGDATRLVTTVYNNTGSNIAKGSVVYISGRHSSNLPTIALAQANSEQNSYKTFALVETDIPTSNSGRVIQAGRIENLNLPTSSYTDGDILYLSSTVAGGYTTTKPLAPNHICKLGSVTRAHPTLGGIEIKIENGWQIDELSDVQIALVPADSTLLQFSRVDSLWHDVSPATALGNRTWRTGGNGSVNSNYFIGSTNNASLRFRTNNTERIVLDSIGNLTINQKTAGNNQSSNLLNFNATGSTGNAQSGYIVYNGNGGTSGGSLQLYNLNGGINLYPSNGDIWMAATNPQLYTTSGGPRFTNASTSAGFTFGNYSTQSSGSLFSVKNTYTDGAERNPFTIFANGNIKIGQIGLTTVDSGYAVDMTGNAVRISNTAGTSTPNATALLDLTSTNRGLLIPRMTSTQRNAISTPASQLIVANTTDKTVDMYNGTSWNTIGGGYTDEIAALQTMGATIKTAPIGQPVLPVTGSAMVSARSYFSAIYLNREATITGASWFQSTQGVYVGTGGGYNGIGLYRDSLGTLLLVDSTTRDTTIWKAATNTWNQKSFAGGTRTLQPGVYYLMALVNTVSGSFPAGQTAPSIGNWSTPSGNGGTFTLVSNSRKIMGGVQTGVTALPTSQAMTAWNNLANFYYSLYLY